MLGNNNEPLVLTYAGHRVVAAWLVADICLGWPATACCLACCRCHMWSCKHPAVYVLFTDALSLSLALPLSCRLLPGPGAHCGLLASIFSGLLCACTDIVCLSLALLFFLPLCCRLLSRPGAHCGLPAYRDGPGLRAAGLLDAGSAGGGQALPLLWWPGACIYCCKERACCSLCCVRTCVHTGLKQVFDRQQGCCGTVLCLRWVCTCCCRKE
jgi:hypothetical protein